VICQVVSVRGVRGRLARGGACPSHGRKLHVQKVRGHLAEHCPTDEDRGAQNWGGAQRSLRPSVRSCPADAACRWRRRGSRSPLVLPPSGLAPFWVMERHGPGFAARLKRLRRAVCSGKKRGGGGGEAVDGRRVSMANNGQTRSRGQRVEIESPVSAAASPVDATLDASMPEGEQARLGKLHSQVLLYGVPAAQSARAAAADRISCSADGANAGRLGVGSCTTQLSHTSDQGRATHGVWPRMSSGFGPPSLRTSPESPRNGTRRASSPRPSRGCQTLCRGSTCLPEVFLILLLLILPFLSDGSLVPDEGSAHPQGWVRRKSNCCLAPNKRMTSTLKC